METFIQETAEQTVPPELTLITSLSCYFMLVLLVVGGLFVYITEPNRDVNTTIQRRYVGLTMVMLVAAFLITTSPDIPKYLGELWETLPKTYALTSSILLIPMLVNLRNDLLI